MKTSGKSLLLQLNPIALAVLAGVCTTSVYAQTATPSTPPQTTSQAAQAVERIEVTGTRLKRTDQETPSVVQIITREAIANSGQTTIEELLRSLSVVDAGSVQDGAASGFIGGVATASLRGLGSQSTLVLINGRRVAPVAAVDINFGRGSLISLNSIPRDAIERIEVLKDGASAIYGSDAIAGVINFVLRKDYNGMQAYGSYGANEKGIGPTASGGVIFGMGDPAKNRWNVFAGLDVFKRDGVMHNQLKGQGELETANRIGNLNNELSRFTPDSSASPFANYYRVPASLAGTSTLPDGSVVANNNLSGINFLGTLNRCPTELTVGQGVPRRPAGFAATTPSLANGLCRFVFDDADQAIAEQERLNGVLRATYALTNGMTAYADLMVSQTKTTETGIPRALTTNLVSTGNRTAVTWPRINGSFLTTNGLILPVGHPDNPTNGSASPIPVQLIYRFTDLPQLDINQLRSTRITAGLEGSFGAWDWQTGLLYTRQENSRNQTNRLRKSLLEASLANGTYRFTVPNNAAGLASVGSDARNDGEATIQAIDASASRELFSLSGGAAGLAVGAEFRKESLESVPDAAYREGDYIGLVANGTSGKRDIFAGYAELRLPVFKSLELQTALRHERYSDFGDSNTGKLGFKWTALPSQLAFRGTAATGFRAPSISQISNSFLLSFNNFQERRVIDNLRCNNSDPNAPVSRGNPANNRDCNVLGRTVNTPNPGAIPTVVSANPNLKPERSRSITFGMVLSPTDRIEANVDVWYFLRNNEIRVQRGVDVVDAYNANPTANNALVIRDPNPQSWLPGIANSGPIILLVRQYGNFEYTKTAGVDYDMTFRLPKQPWGALSFTLAGTFVKRFDQLILAGAEVQRLVGTTTADLPKTKGSLTANWERAAWSAWARFNYEDGLSSSTTGSCLSSTSAYNLALQAGGWCGVGKTQTTDIGMSYRGIKNLSLSASILNVTDDYGRSNGVPTTFNYWNNGTQGQLGRRFNLNMRYTFW